MRAAEYAPRGPLYLLERRHSPAEIVERGTAVFVYVGRPEMDWARRLAINLLGNGLHEAKHHEDALSVKEAELAMKRRIGASEESILIAQGNLANTYAKFGRLEQAMRARRGVYAGWLKLAGEEDNNTLREANNYAVDLRDLERFEEAKTLLRKTIPVARRVLGESNELTLRMRWTHAISLYMDLGATLDDLREAVTTLEETQRVARRVLGGAHPLTMSIERDLRRSRAALRARETPPK